jgi:hypothetical protein
MVTVPTAPSTQPSQLCEVCRVSIVFSRLTTSQHPLFLSIVIRKPSFRTIFIVQKPVRAKRLRCVTYKSFLLLMSVELKIDLLSSIVTRRPNFRGLITVVRNARRWRHLPSSSMLEPLLAALK